MAPGWTLNFEMFFYIVFAAGLMLPRKYGLPAIVVTLSALILLGLATKPTQAAFIYWTNPLILEFAFGLAIAYAYELGKTLSPKMGMGVFGLGVLILGIFSLSHHPTPDRVYAGYLALGWGLPAALIVAGAALSDRGALATARWRIPRLLGDASYSIYLTHLLVFYALNFVVFHALNFHVSHLGIPIVLATLLVGICVHFYVERPIGRILSSRFSTPVRTDRLRRQCEFKGVGEVFARKTGLDHKPLARNSGIPEFTVPAVPVACPSLLRTPRQTAFAACSCDCATRARSSKYPPGKAGGFKVGGPSKGPFRLYMCHDFTSVGLSPP